MMILNINLYRIDSELRGSEKQGRLKKIFLSQNIKAAGVK